MKRRKHVGTFVTAESDSILAVTHDLPPDKRDELRQDVCFLLSNGYSLTGLGKVFRPPVTHQTVANWRDGRDVPKGERRNIIRNLAEEVRATATKLANTGQPPIADSGEMVVPSAGLRGRGDPFIEERGMGVAYEVKAPDKPYLKILNTCLEYNREDVRAGKISQMTIAAAVEGGLEERGCADWDARRWWTELQAADKRLRAVLHKAPRRTRR